MQDAQQVGEVPKVKPTKPGETPMFLRPKDDITAEEAACLVLAIFMSTKGLTPEKYKLSPFSFTKEDVERIFDKAWRHLAPDPELVAAKEKAAAEDNSQPEPVVDANGKKHYTMNCRGGNYGVAGKDVTGKKSSQS